MENVSAAEQRAFAVAKLKRAASLPRMQNGRRPPMHVEAVSEGERTREEDMEEDNAQRTTAEEDLSVAQSTQDMHGVGDASEETVKLETDPTPDPDPDPDPEPDQDAEPESFAPPEPVATPAPETETESVPQKKRRSRSRSRSRGSKDLRGKMKAIQSPIPSPMPAGADSSPDEAPLPLPPFHVLTAPTVVSPIPSRFQQLQAQRLLMTPEPMMYYPTAASPTSPGPMLPSLEALQRGLYRSNSAAARMMAMHKLTGGTEPLDQSFSSPANTPPIGARVTRNNTVSGGERSAARKILLRRLGERIKEADTSGGEDVAAPAIPPKRRKRRSRRGSASGSAVVDDRELSSTAPETPIVPPTPNLPGLSTVPEPFFRAPSAAPSENAAAARRSLERERQTTLAKLLGEVVAEPERERTSTPRNRRSVVVEDEDDQPDYAAPSAMPRYPGLPTPHSTEPASVDMPTRQPFASDAPSGVSAGSADSVPVFLAEQTAYRVDMFPQSPFNTPLKEKASRDEDEEQVLYQAELNRLRRPWASPADRDVSWVDEPMLRNRMPVRDDYDDEDEEAANEDAPEDTGDDAHEDTVEDVGEEPELDEPPLSAASEEFPSGDGPFRHMSSASESKNYMDDSMELNPYDHSTPPVSGPDADTSRTTSTMRVSDAFTSSPIDPSRLSLPLADADQMQVSPSGRSARLAPSAWDEVSSRPIAPMMEASSSKSRWEKVRNIISRSNSGTGRRSRANSGAARDRNTDSSVSRESGASVNSNGARGEGILGLFGSQQQQQQPQQQVTPPMLTPSASASILSLSPQALPRGGVSPIPPASTADLLKYGDAKLFPFPGMKQLEEERNRSKGVTVPASVSSPDIASPTTSATDSILMSSSSNQTARSPDFGRERKVSHQASDSQLLSRFQAPPPPLTATNSQGSQIDYFDIPSGEASHSLSHAGSAHNLKLPMNREGVRRWLSAKKIFSSPLSPTSPQSPSNFTTMSPIDARPRSAKKKPSLSDLLKGGRKESDLAADWEEVTNDRDTPTSPNATPSTARPNLMIMRDLTISDDSASRDRSLSPANDEMGDLMRRQMEAARPSYTTTPDLPSSYPSPPEPMSSATPDPLSSLDDYGTRSTTASSSTLSSRFSAANQSASEVGGGASQGAIVLERLDEMLGRGSRSPMWASAIDDPPRKLVLSSPVLQVVNANTVKDRFLFLFNDVLVVAKPIMHESDVLLDPTKPTPLDRKFVVKSVVRLHQLRFSADRDDPRSKASSGGAPSKNVVVRSFISQFAKDPDHAIATLFEKSRSRDDPVALGQLIFRTLDLDRGMLGEYLSRRTSRLVLKAYVNGFGFTGLRIDKALRAFLMSIGVPPSSRQPSALEYLVDAFAVRWYEANADIVPFSKDLAIRLSRAVLQLNEVLHGAIVQEPGMTPYPKRNVTGRDFTTAFRKYDQHKAVSDDLLDKIYTSLRHERLSQARSSASANASIPITIKRALPLRLTYRTKSEPIVLRIPQPDAKLNIQLYGQDLVFDPPVLSFAKSSEASFRVTCTSLGAKTMLMLRSGANALAYTGLPLSNPLAVERAFMRNTFQVAFADADGAKRRYMFSVDDPLIRHQWTVSLKRQIEIAVAARAGQDPAAPGAGTSRFHRAAENTAFKVLRETLLSSPPVAPAGRDAPPAFGAGFAPPGKAAVAPHGNGHAAGPRRQGEVRQSRLGAPNHVRSKSRSAVYHRHGPGRFELDLVTDSSPENRHGVGVGLSGGDTDADDSGGHAHRVWSGRDLEMVCQQNSSIALVLSYLQVGSPEPDQPFQWAATVGS